MLRNVLKVAVVSQTLTSYVFLASSCKTAAAKKRTSSCPDCTTSSVSVLTFRCQHLLSPRPKAVKSHDAARGSGSPRPKAVKAHAARGPTKQYLKKRMADSKQFNCVAAISALRRGRRCQPDPNIVVMASCLSGGPITGVRAIFAAEGASQSDPARSLANCPRDPHAQPIAMRFAAAARPAQRRLRPVLRADLPSSVHRKGMAESMQFNCNWTICVLRGMARRTRAEGTCEAADGGSR